MYHSHNMKVFVTADQRTSTKFKLHQESNSLGGPGCYCEAKVV
jgi:hypothetical protein